MIILYFYGGHNGVKSIINLCGTNLFPRIKIGIGEKPNSDWDLADWVLSKFSKDELSILHDSFVKLPDILKLMLDGKITDAMNKYN